MNGWIDILVQWGIPALAGGVLTSAVLFIRGRVRVRSPLQVLVEKIAEQVSCLTPIVGLIYAIQRPQLDAQAALLEAMRGEMNGNLDRALISIGKAREKFDKFTNATVVPECKALET